jgi:hypothetical protein
MSSQPDTRDDSVLGDVRRARANLVAECDNDLDKLVDRLIAEQSEHPERVVNLRAKKEQAKK